MANYPAAGRPISVRSDRTRQSVRSSGTDGSAVSTASIDSTATINSVHSLMSLVRQISHQLYPKETLVTDLRNWLAAVDPVVYRREMPWQPNVVAAYNEYKRRATVHSSAHKAFLNYFSQTRSYTTPEQHLERARLAVAWGEAALRYASIISSDEMTTIHTFCHMTH